MIQLPEACDKKSEAFKAGYKTIAEITSHLKINEVKLSSTRVAPCQESFQRDIRTLQPDA